MGVTPSTFSDGTTMVAADVRAEFTAFYDWLNGGVVNADLAAASVETRHAPRIEHYPWPANASVGQFGSVFGHMRYEGMDHRFHTDRITVPLAGLDDLERMIIPRTGQVVTGVPQNTPLEIRASWGAIEQHVLGTARYPDEAGAMYVAYRNLLTGAITTFGVTRRLIPMGSAASVGYGPRAEHSAFVKTVMPSDEGIEVFLLYVKAGTGFSAHADADVLFVFDPNIVIYVPHR